MSNDESMDATEPIRELLSYNQSKQVISALKYGIVPFIGHVLEKPNKKNLTLLLNLLDAYGEIDVALGVDPPEITKDILKELKLRADEIKIGIVKEETEPDCLDPPIDAGFISNDNKEKTTHG